MLPVVLFIISGAWFKVAFNFITLLYSVTLAHDMIKFPVMSLIWHLYSALPSSSSFENNLLETINNYTLHLFSLEGQSMEGDKGGHFALLFHLPLLHLSLLQVSWKFWISFKAAWLYCYVSRTCFCFCLRLNNYLRIPPRDLPQGWMVMARYMWEYTCRQIHITVVTSGGLGIYPWTIVEL